LQYPRYALFPDGGWDDQGDSTLVAYVLPATSDDFDIGLFLGILPMVYTTIVPPTPPVRRVEYKPKSIAGPALPSLPDQPVVTSHDVNPLLRTKWF